MKDRGRSLRRTRGENANRIETAKKADNGPAGLYGPISPTFAPERVRAHIERQICPWCGRGPYKIVAMHVSKVHGIGRRELRELAGLMVADSICDPEESARVSKRMTRRGIPPALAAKRGQGKRRYTEAGRAVQAAKLENVDRQHQRKPRGLCIVCGGQIPDSTRRPTRKTCSDDCRKARRVQASKEIRARERATLD